MDPLHDAPDCTIVIPIPPLDDVILHLHTRRLAAKSVLLRAFLAGVSPPDRPRLPPGIPRLRLPRLLPSPPAHPVVFLPVPDPSSIQPLFHWMYSGSTDHLENALNHGRVHWQGLARNVEYLGLSTDIKVFLGRWYRDWLLPAPRCHPVCTPRPSDELINHSDDSDLDSECDDDYVSPCTSDDESDRGRSRDVKPLVQLCGQLRLCTT